MRSRRAQGAGLMVAALIGCSDTGPATPTGPTAPPGAEASCFEPPAWRILGDLNVRSQDKNGGVLLLRLVPDKYVLAARRRDGRPEDPEGSMKAVYRYRPGLRELEISDESAWDQAQGAVGECGRQEARASTLPLKVDSDHGFTLRLGDRVIPTAGKGVVAMAVSPGLDVAAVLSSEIPPAPGMLFARGGSGRHYHQLFRVQDGTPIGETTQVAMSSEHSQIVACFSPEGKHVLYFVGDRLCVIPAPS